MATVLHWGAINMQNSFWYLMAWTWKQGTPHLSTAKTAPGEMKLTSGSSAHKATVPWIETKESFRTLGIYISPTCSQQTQMKILRQLLEEYNTSLSKATLSAADAYCSYMTYLRPRLQYPLPCSSLTQAQCQKIQAPALSALLPKLHLNQHTPHAVIFGSHQLGGLGLPDLYTDQGHGQLNLLIGHLGLNDETGQLIRIAMSRIQVHVGSASSIFTLPYPATPMCPLLDTIWKTRTQECVKFVN